MCLASLFPEFSRGISLVPDIRQLPSLVPQGLQNATTRLISGQLKERIGEFEKSIESGNAETLTEDKSVTQCSFTLHGRMDQIMAPQQSIDEYEREIENPSGIPLNQLPKPRFNGVLMSEECGVLLEVEGLEGIS